ncbi:MAG: flagellar assembly protein FliW [Desulforhabdus sp.]|jgi:flagellar assembly factor FliW|nr:flagellar assembly protein FliW [Desulforhabdus sp.]
MRIDTIRFGPLELGEETAIQFPWGIPGFENLKRYVLLEHGNGPFQWLQAVDDPRVAFVVCPPEVLGIKYKVPRDNIAQLEVEHPDDLLVLTIVSFDREKKTPRPHLTGPLLFNSITRIAAQWSIDSRDLPKYIESVE